MKTIINLGLPKTPVIFLTCWENFKIFNRNFGLWSFINKQWRKNELNITNKIFMLQFCVCGVIKTNNKTLDEIKHVLHVSIILLSLKRFHSRKVCSQKSLLPLKKGNFIFLYTLINLCSSSFSTLSLSSPETWLRPGRWNWSTSVLNRFHSDAVQNVCSAQNFL